MHPATRLREQVAPARHMAEAERPAFVRAGVDRAALPEDRFCGVAGGFLITRALP